MPFQASKGDPSEFLQINWIDIVSPTSKLAIWISLQTSHSTSTSVGVLNQGVLIHIDRFQTDLINIKAVEGYEIRQSIIY